MPNTQKLIVIGMDGLDPVIAQKMMDKGDLPNFSAFAKEGSFHALGTSNPPQSPVAWSCFIAGGNPGEHDVFDFIAREPKTYLPEIGMTQTDKDKGGLKNRRKGKTFWDALGEKGIPSTILRCPMTFPAEKLNGRLLAGMGTPDIKGTQGVFSFYTTRPADSKDIQGRVYAVAWQGDKINAEISGPKVNQGGEVKEISLPVEIAKAGPGKLRITCQGHSEEIGAGQWSGWFRLKFNLGFMKSVYGICRFQLKALEPELELYASPVNIDPQAPAFPISYPSDYAKELFDTLGPFYTQGMPYDTWALNEGRLDEEAFLSLSQGILKDNVSSMNMEMDRFKGGLLFVYFGITDLTQHMFWRYIDPQHPNKGENASPEVRNAIDNIYKQMDGVLGEIRRRLDEKTMLLVISDHGFGSFRRAVHVNSWLRENGYLSLKGGDREGQELFANVDWARTRAYSVGFGGIYINQFGREKQGTVYRGAETEQLKKELIQKLTSWRDGGSPMIKKVYASEELYSGPYAPNGPDLFIGFLNGWRASWQTALGAAPESLVENNMKKWSGDHLCDPSLVPGVLFSNRKITAENLNLTDIPSLILDYFQIPVEGKTKIKTLAPQ